MTSFVPGDSAFVGGPYDGLPINSSPFVAKNNQGGLNVNTSGLPDTGINLTIEGDADDRVYTSTHSAPDIIDLGGGDDIANAGGDDDLVYGGDGKDIIRGGTGNDVIRGGKGADVLIGGQGSDIFVIKGDPVDGAFGVDSDLQFDPISTDPNGELIIDAILDFNPEELDALVLQDLQVEGIGSVDYDPDSGNVTLTDSASPDVSRVIANLPKDLDIDVVDQGDGNWTLL